MCHRHDIDEPGISPALQETRQSRDDCVLSVSNYLLRDHHRKTRYLSYVCMYIHTYLDTSITSYSLHPLHVFFSLHWFLDFKIPQSSVLDFGALISHINHLEYDIFRVGIIAVYLVCFTTRTYDYCCNAVVLRHSSKQSTLLRRTITANKHPSVEHTRWSTGVCKGESKKCTAVDNFPRPRSILVDVYI